MPIQPITPFLWFDDQAEEAAKLYTSIFPNSAIIKTVRYGKAGPCPEGTVMTVEFQLMNQSFVALNGGPQFAFTEAISFVVNCETQDEVDAYWEKLTAGGAEVACGWLKDKFGLSWQIVPRAAQVTRRSRSAEIRARHEGHAHHEKARYRRARTSSCWSGFKSADETVG